MLSVQARVRMEFLLRTVRDWWFAVVQSNREAEPRGRLAMMECWVPAEATAVREIRAAKIPRIFVGPALVRRVVLRELRVVAGQVGSVADPVVAMIHPRRLAVRAPAGLWAVPARFVSEADHVMEQKDLMERMESRGTMDQTAQ